jgi:hypothetical protein
MNFEHPTLNIQSNLERRAKKFLQAMDDLALLREYRSEPVAGGIDDFRNSGRNISRGRQY